MGFGCSFEGRSGNRRNNTGTVRQLHSPRGDYFTMTLLPTAFTALHPLGGGSGSGIFLGGGGLGLGEHWMPSKGGF